MLLPLAGEDVADGTWREAQDSTGGECSEVTKPGTKTLSKLGSYRLPRILPLKSSCPCPPAASMGLTRGGSAHIGLHLQLLQRVGVRG